jgi:SAM-dependent methyltransferase
MEIAGGLREGVHRAAAEGFSNAADSYGKGRPDYPPALDSWLAEELGVGPGRTVVDVGAGTGKFTTRLVASGARVIAIEPVAKMREKLALSAPEAEVLDGSAEAIPLASASVDAIVCATAFHWFATRKALAEMHRVLKPGGMLGLVWNVRDTTVEWVARLDAIIESRVDGTPRFYTGEWRAPFPFDGFTPLQERRLAHAHTGAVEDVIINRVRSSSVMSSMPPLQWAQIERELRALIENEPTLAGEAVVTVPYVTLAFNTKKV